MRALCRGAAAPSSTPVFALPSAPAPSRTLVSAVPRAHVPYRAPVSAVPRASVPSRAPVSAVPGAPVSAVSRAPAFVGSKHSQSSELSSTSPLCTGDLFPPIPLICPTGSRSFSWWSSPAPGQFRGAFSSHRLLQALCLRTGARGARSQYHTLSCDVLAPSAGIYGVAFHPQARFRHILGEFSRSCTAATGRSHGVRLYYRSTRGSDGSQNQFQVVDLRSDTLSTPNAEMRDAMAQAEVGDDVYGEDPTINELQQQVARLFGTEEALFVTSGTMGNLISVMCHCRSRGEELLLGDEAHLHLFEQGGVAQIAGVSPRLVRTLPDGRLDLEDLEWKIQHEYPDPHYPHTRLICLENTHNRTGGRVLPLSHLQEVRLLADRYGLAVHMDGARVMNAAVALGKEPAQIVQHCDSVSMCLSKGLGAPVGAVIGGRKEFIMECLRMRKVLGGGMRQAGVLAAPSLVALAQAEETLKKDHHNAKRFAEGVQEVASPLCSVDLSSVETNIVLFTVDEPRISPQELCDRMWEVSEPEVAEIGRGVRVRMFTWFARTVRAVWYRDISEEDTELALKKLKFVLQKYREELQIM